MVSFASLPTLLAHGALYLPIRQVCMKTPAAAVRVSKQGLAAAMATFAFVRDGKNSSLTEAMAALKGSFHTGFIRGSKPKPAKQQVEVPYKGAVLTGDALLAQLKKCVGGTSVVQRPTTAGPCEFVMGSLGFVSGVLRVFHLWLLWLCERRTRPFLRVCPFLPGDRFVLLPVNRVDA